MGISSFECYLFAYRSFFSLFLHFHFLCYSADVYIVSLHISHYLWNFDTESIITLSIRIFLMLVLSFNIFSDVWFHVREKERLYLPTPYLLFTGCHILSLQNAIYPWNSYSFAEKKFTSIPRKKTHQNYLFSNLSNKQTKKGGCQLQFYFRSQFIWKWFVFCTLQMIVDKTPSRSSLRLRFYRQML